MIGVDERKGKSHMGSAMLIEMAIVCLAMGLIFLGAKSIEPLLARFLGLCGVENRAAGIALTTLLLLSGLLLLPHSIQGFPVGLIIKNLLIGALLLGALVTIREMVRTREAN